MSIDKVLFITGGIFLFIAFVILVVGLIKSRNDHDPKKTQQEIEQTRNTFVIAASVCFGIAVVLIGTGLFTYLKNCKPYAPPPTPSPAANEDEQMIDAKLQEGWFLQPEDSTQTNPHNDPCIIHKDNVADWGLQHGAEACEDVEGWMLLKNTKFYRYDPETSRTTNYRGLRVLLNDKIPGIGKEATGSPAFYASQ